MSRKRIYTLNPQILDLEINLGPIIHCVAQSSEMREILIPKYVWKLVRKRQGKKKKDLNSCLCSPWVTKGGQGGWLSSKIIFATCILWPLSKTDNQDEQTMYLTLDDNSDILLTAGLELKDEMKP